ncbi:hypothetical protein K1T71_014562 [Dendrolimus kikuchii]|uniref:Uncharacterized protein n=1 Tax=Dendrolimus kikuchii TaxID=765133 RepID=A0ACC1CEP9_9NEOP|nr:hypothetical protein K1T71_014562 [Dendrolimus kikuchii]
MSEYCFICAKLLTESEVITVERGMKTLINASIERADEFSEYLKNQKSVTIHENCRKNHIRKSSIAAANKRQREEQEATASPPRTRSRISESPFCFKELCLFYSILETARIRDDAIAKAVLARVEFEYDLLAAEAHYHRDCYAIFLKHSTGAKMGRPKDEATNLAMEDIFTNIENSDDCQFTLNELQNVCKTTTLDYRTIKLRVKVKYGDKIIITEKSGASTFICLVDNHHDILNQAWYEKKMNKTEERLRVLDAAAAIIREDIQTAVFDNCNYPPPSRMLEDLNNEIPESLTYLVERVI